MSPQAIETLDALLDRMWADYLALNPRARAVRDLFEARGEQVVNDHIALRTFDLPMLDLEVLARPFLASGYREAGRYHFPAKKLFAKHFAAPGRPYVFISQLRTDELGPEPRALIHGLVDQVDPSLPERFDFCTVGRPWSLDHATYLRLAEASEYAGWVASHGLRPNHFTVLVNALKSSPSLEAVNALLVEHGFALNESGGFIKGSPAQLLEQSSTLANTVRVTLEDGTFELPGCFYEFARRYPGPDGTLFGGFIAESADRIFESTDRRDPR